MSSAMLDLGAQPVTLAQQIEELKRELRQREAVYPRLTALPGLPVSAAQARAWWEKVGAVQRVRIERRDAPAAETGDQS